jgi:putative addiction module component (TIGR02574 family)
MSIDEIEAVVLSLGPTDRARLAERLLESLDQLPAEESEKLWAEEALRRDHDLDADATSARPSADVFRDAFVRLK